MSLIGPLLLATFLFCVGVYGLTFLAALLAMTPALIWLAEDRPLTRRCVLQPGSLACS
jgi:apolipoprotein N-acyltransferase